MVFTPNTVASQVSKYMANAVSVSSIWGNIIYNVKESPYLAKGDGVTDDTAAINAAINAAYNAGGGIVVAYGKFKINGQVLVKKGVTFLGNNSMGTNHDAGVIYGSHFIITQTTTNPIILEKGAAIRGFAFHYPNQPVTNASPVLGDIIAYPFTIVCGEGSQVSDMWCSGAYDFIDFTSLCTIENIGGYPLKRGLYTDDATDAVRIHNIHFNPNYLVATISIPVGFYSFCAKNLNSSVIEIVNGDDIKATNIFGFCQTYGIYTGITGGSGGGTPSLQLTNFGFDQCRQAFSFGGNPSNFGILVENGYVTPNLGPDNTLRAGIMFRGLASDSGGLYLFNNVNFYGAGDVNAGADTGSAASYIRGSGTPYQSTLIMKNVTFRHFTGDHPLDLSTFSDCRVDVEGYEVPSSVITDPARYRQTQEARYTKIPKVACSGTGNSSLSIAPTADIGSKHFDYIGSGFNLIVFNALTYAQVFSGTFQTNTAGQDQVFADAIDTNVTNGRFAVIVSREFYGVLTTTPANQVKANWGLYKITGADLAFTGSTTDPYCAIIAYIDNQKYVKENRLPAAKQRSLLSIKTLNDLELF